ncbi:MAG: DUF2971 domain-containing protein [Methylobacter sp.]|nr:DUF2971 domain-containing protein [Methylobacter sp.]
MSSRTHDRSHFFKYASFQTAKQVIESKSFRWSSPTKFNDPFDHQAGFVLDFNPDEFAKLLTASIERIVFSDAVPTINSDSLFSAQTLRFRSIRDRLPREEFLRDMHKASIESAAKLPRSIDQFNVAIQEQLCHSRVFCVSERHDNVVMWSHYADEHKGVVFKLRCIDEIDNTLLAARQVDYTDTFIAFPSTGQYIKHMTGEHPIKIASLCWKITLTKHIDWAYEKEWRVHIPLLDESAGNGYTIYSEDPRIFEAVYLGCRMEDEELAVIVELIRRHLPETKIFRGKKSTTAFALSFTEIDEI